MMRHPFAFNHPHRSLFLIVFFVSSVHLLPVGCTSGSREKVFPGKEWDIITPEKAGLNEAALTRIDSLMKKANANGVLIHNGYLVTEWCYGGAKETHFEVQSITKSITSSVLGLALHDGLIPSLDAKVKDYYPGLQVGPYTDEITFRHLVTASSGIKSTITEGRYFDPDNMKPGIESRYHNDHFHQLAAALTYIYCQELGEVFSNRVLQPIMAQDSMRWGYHRSSEVTCGNGRQTKVVGGYAFTHWSARDLARVGYLYLNEGNWDGRQLLPAAFTREARRAIPIPVMDMAPDASPDKRSNAKYGFGWRGKISKNGKELWYMSGNGGQFCIVLPELNLVMTKINSYKEKPYTGIDRFEEHIWNLFPQINE